MINLVSCGGGARPSMVFAIERQYSEDSAVCSRSADPAAPLTFESCTSQYYYGLCRCMENTLQWLLKVLPENERACLESEQGQWIALRTLEFRRFNRMYGLLSGGAIPFDPVGLLLAQAGVVRARAIELESVYPVLRAWRQPPILQLVVG